MIPPKFGYIRPASLEQAIDQLARAGPEAELLAGGQSLIPLLKLRLASPRLLVDIDGLSELAYIRREGECLCVGALTRHQDLASHPLAHDLTPLLAHAASQIGDPQIRHRGTLGGSLAHADPAADLPAVLLAYEAEVVAAGPGGERHLPLIELFTGFYETALAPAEIIREVRVPVIERAGWAFQKFVRRAIDWATVGVVALRGRGIERVALMSMGPRPMRAPGVERALIQGASAAEASEAVLQATDPPSDSWASAAFRARIAPVLTERALDEAQCRREAAWS